MTNWLQCGIETQANWPSTQKEITFDGYHFVLMPPSANNSASVHVELRGISQIEGMTAVNRLLSLLSWKDDQPAINHYGWSGNPVPVPVPHHNSRLGFSPTIHFPSSIASVTDPKGKLALSLYREGKSLNSVPYQFLSYFKILNIFWNDKTIDGKNPLKEGIRSTLTKLTAPEVVLQVNSLNQRRLDPVDYLYTSCRCAVAHAFANPVVDPDDISDLHPLSDMLIVIEALAAHMIETKLNIMR